MAGPKSNRRQTVPRNTSGLKRTAGPGRPKGVPNKATREVKEWMTAFAAKPEYRASVERRLLSGKAPHIEAHMWKCLWPAPKDGASLTNENGAWVFRWAAE